MKWFINMPTRMKLILCFGIMWAMLATVIFMSHRVVSEMADSAKEMNDRQYTIALELANLRSSQNYNRAQMLELLLAEDPVTRDGIEQTITERSEQIDKTVANLIAIDTDPNDREKLAALKEDMNQYRQARELQIALIHEGKADEARTIGAGIQEERFAKIRSLAVELGDKAYDDVDARLNEKMLRSQYFIRLFIIIGIAAFILVALIIFAIDRFISVPLRRLSLAADRIASGDLTAAPGREIRKDEVGALTASFSRMTVSLQNMANVAERIASGELTVEITPQSSQDILGNALERMAKSLRESTSDIAEAVNQLDLAASEILAATTQVAAGTVETASAINETTTTVEEVRQAARLSSDKSKIVSENARNVAQVSQSGQKAVEDTASGMLHIRDQMDSIAQAIVRLSEQGQSIGTIISSVTDLADQSNLLAVNAAIEAARAGEQGKGFVVVAQEIKSMAEQSKRATSQIREILGEVQKATGAAVMATEQGSKAVEDGVRQSAQAGNAIQVLTASSAEAAQTALQIAASSQQQVVGMDQIGIAMENINQAGSQTAASMQQAETAARNLHELGQRLKGLVDQYRT